MHGAAMIILEWASFGGHRHTFSVGYVPRSSIAAYTGSAYIQL